MAKEVAVGLEEGASLVARAEKGLEVRDAGFRGRGGRLHEGCATHFRCAHEQG